MARTPPARTAGQRPFLLVVAGVLALGATMQAVEIREDLRLQDGAQGVSGPGSGDASGGDVVQATVGPPVGAPVAAYVAERQAALAAAPSDVEVAVVSFSQLLVGADVEAVVGSAVEVLAVTLRVPLSGREPRTVPAADDVAAAVGNAADQAVASLRPEEAEFRQVVDSGTFSAEFEQDARDRLGEIAEAIATLEGGGPIVHGAVVTGPVAALRALAEAPGVRLVDPAPPGTDVTSSVFSALLPGDVDVVTAGRQG